MNQNSYIKDNYYLTENIIDYEEYYLIKENNAYKFIIYKTKSDIIIKCNNYEIELNNNNFSMINNIKLILNSINDIYDFIINLFKENKVIIKNIINNKIIILLLKIYNDYKEKNIEILLVYNKEYKSNYKDIIINELNNNFTNLKYEIFKLKNEINILKNELIKLKNSNNKFKTKNLLISKENKNNSNPQDIQFFKDLTKDSFNDDFSFDNTFSLFKSINDIIFLIYSNKDKSIISYDLINEKKINKIKNAHNMTITNFRHYLDTLFRRDLILSISTDDNNIKLWNINDFQCLINIKNINQKGFLFSACLLKENNNSYILSSNSNLNDCESIKVFNFKGNKINEINDSKNSTYFIDTYYDYRLSKNYIVTGNIGCVKSYDYSRNKLYHKYCDNNNKLEHHSIIINNSEIVMIKLIESSVDGNIRIWNFHSGELLNKLKVCDTYLNGICIWNNDYIFVGCSDKSIKLIKLKKLIIVKYLNGHNKTVSTIKKINHPQYGDCLISQGYDNQIKLWINKNY